MELEDGHEVLINNAPVLFNSTMGRFAWYDQENRRYVFFDEMDPPQPPIVYTEWDWATICLQGGLDDFWIPDEQEVEVQIDARVLGYDVAADPVIVVISGIND